MSAGHTIILGTMRAREHAARFALSAPAGTVADFTPPRRTIPQNKRMQAMLGDVARAKPGGRVLNRDQWKCLFMDALAAETGKDVFRANWQPGLDGQTAVNLGYRSSRLVKADMGELMDFIDAWGAQNGVTFSKLDPEAEAA